MRRSTKITDTKRTIVFLHWKIRPHRELRVKLKPYLKISEEQSQLVSRSGMPVKLLTLLETQRLISLTSIQSRREVARQTKQFAGNIRKNSALIVDIMMMIGAAGLQSSFQYKSRSSTHTCLAVPSTRIYSGAKTSLIEDAKESGR